MDRCGIRTGGDERGRGGRGKGTGTEKDRWQCGEMSGWGLVALGAAFEKPEGTYIQKEMKRLGD